MFDYVKPIHTDPSFEAKRRATTDGVPFIGGKKKTWSVPNAVLYVDGDPLDSTDTKGLANDGGRSLRKPKAPAPGDPTRPDYSHCRYYDGIARSYGCKYHQAAAQVCRGQNATVNFIVRQCGISEAKLNCIRKCLVDSDKAVRGTPPCSPKCEQGKCTSKACVDNYHNSCFWQCQVAPACYGGNWGPYPNDGD